MVLGVLMFKLTIFKLQFAQILGQLKIINFPFWNNAKSNILSVPILKHITVFQPIKRIEG